MAKPSVPYERFGLGRKKSSATKRKSLNDGVADKPVSVREPILGRYQDYERSFPRETVSGFIVDDPAPQINRPSAEKWFSEDSSRGARLSLGDVEEPPAELTGFESIPTRKVFELYGGLTDDQKNLAREVANDQLNRSFDEQGASEATRRKILGAKDDIMGRMAGIRERNKEYAKLVSEIPKPARVPISEMPASGILSEHVKTPWQRARVPLSGGESRGRKASNVLWNTLGQLGLAPPTTSRGDLRERSRKTIEDQVRYNNAISSDYENRMAAVDRQRNSELSSWSGIQGLEKGSRDQPSQVRKALEEQNKIDKSIMEAEDNEDRIRLNQLGKKFEEKYMTVEMPGVSFNPYEEDPKEIEMMMRRVKESIYVKKDALKRADAGGELGADPDYNALSAAAGMGSEGVTADELRSLEREHSFYFAKLRAALAAQNPNANQDEIAQLVMIATARFQEWAQGRRVRSPLAPPPAGTAGSDGYAGALDEYERLGAGEVDPSTTEINPALRRGLESRDESVTGPFNNAFGR